MTTGNLRDGVEAKIVSGQLTNCSDVPEIDQHSGASAWISLDPAPGTPDADNTNAIIQIGMIRCINAVHQFTGCDGDLNFFWALGGCGPLDVPVPQKLTGEPSPGGTYTFSIQRLSTGVSLKKSGVQVKFIPETDPAISCWVNDNLEANWLTERIDDGDSVNAATFLDMRIHKSIGWVSLPSSPALACNVNTFSSSHPSTCLVLEDNTFLRVTD